jgi:dCMP deaminase
MIVKSPVSWHEYFFSIMDAVSLRSKDPNTKVGAVIVDRDNKIVSVGYNGFPSGFSDTEDRWQAPNKYDYVAHAELNAIINSNSSTKNTILYVPFWPCKNCAKYLASAGIKEIHVKSDYYKNSVSEEIFKECGIVVFSHI